MIRLINFARIGYVACFASATAITGCASNQYKHSEGRTSSAEADANSAIGTMKATPPVSVDEDVVQMHRASYVNPVPIAMSATKTAPELNCHTSFAPSGPTTLLQFSQQMTKDCGVPVRVTPDALSVIEGGTGVAGSQSSQGGQGAAGLPPGASPSAGIALPPLPGMPSAGPMYGSSMGGGSPQSRLQIKAEGTLSALLDTVTARLGLSWRYTNGVVTVFYLDTRVYKIYSIPTATKMDSIVTSGTQSSAGVSGGGGSSGGSSGSSGGGGGGVSGSSGSNQTTEVSMSTSPNDDLQKSVSSMLTPSVGRMFVSASNRTVTVTDTPEVLDRLGSYFDGLNTFSMMQVMMDVKVISVTLTDTNENGINWALAFQNVANTYGIGLKSAFQASTGATTGTVNILAGNSKFNGSQAIVDALAKQGRVSIVTQPTVTALNFEPVPVQVARQTSYLAQVQTTTGGSSDLAQTSLTPGTVTTGFNMNLLPYILPDGQTVLLQYSLNISSLINIRTVTSGSNSIEIPEVDNKISSQKVRLKSGETLVISGFDQMSDDTERSGTGKAKFWGFGGGATVSKKRELLVVLITPKVLN